jgi:hypothetical protein
MDPAMWPIVFCIRLYNVFCYDLSNDTFLERSQGWEAFVGRGPSSFLSNLVRRPRGASFVGSCVWLANAFETIVTCRKQVVGQNRVFNVEGVQCGRLVSYPFFSLFVGWHWDLLE